MPAHHLTLGRLLADRLRAQAPTAPARRKLLEHGTRLASAGITAIVEAKDRRRYGIAAAYAIAHAEATALVHGSAAGDAAASDAADPTGAAHHLSRRRRRSIRFFHL